MSDSVEYKCVTTSRDYLKACLVYRYGRAWFWMLWAVLTLMYGHIGYSAIMSLFGDGDPKSRLITLAIFTVMYLAWLWIVFRLPERSYRDHPFVDVEFDMTINEDGLFGRSAELSYEIRWSKFSKAVEKQYHFILFLGMHTFQPIPKRCLGEEETYFVRELIYENIPDTSIWD